ncbi:MAG TPA: CRTAC1 family protein [Thermoanaerobaculia bacterium]|nr:CRTAC1 family protein [Thermoanaerobaculia bacterium]
MRRLARLLRWAAVAVVVLAAGLAVAWKILFREEPSRRTGVTGSLFTDVTAASGVSFRFRGDILDGKLIPTMGGGAALADFDGDGWLDLVLVQQVRNGTRWRKAGQTQPLADCTRLFRNRGDGTFEDVTERSGVVACGWGVTAMWADLDDDGFPDLVIGNAGEPNLVFRNKGDGTFARMEKTGLEGGKFTIGLAALDVDGDGLPDVYIGNYLDTDPLRESKAPGTSFMTPDEYKGQDNQMLRNLGGWKFADVTDASGTRDPGSKTIGAVALDYDGDGKTDLYVANDQWRNSLFHNEGGGVFRDVSDETGTGYPEEGSATAFGRRTRSGMGLVATDLDGDGRPDLYVTNYANEPDTLYRNVEGAVFAESEREAFGGDQDPVLPLSKWGVVALDWDNDGKDDLAVSSGQILSRFFTVVGQWFNPLARNFAVGEKSYAQRQFLFHNESAPGAMRFRDVSAESGDLGRLCVVGRGLSAGDLDGDGREDLVFNPIDAPAIVLRNAAPGGNALEILPVAGADRKTVLGTRVTARTDSGEKVKEFYVVPSYASGSWLPLHFGLGAAASAHVVVRWPDGVSQDLGDVPKGSWRLRKGGTLEPLRARK